MKLADSIIGGEYELALTGLVDALAAGNPPESVPGISTSRCEALPILAKIPLLPPDRSELPGLRDYAGLAHHGEIIRAGYVETTRGCHHTCAHCPITPVYGGRFFALPRATVIADARARCISAHGTSASATPIFSMDRNMVCGSCGHCGKSSPG